MKRYTHGTLGDLSDDLSACPACLDGEPHAHRSRRSSWGSPSSSDSGPGRGPTPPERAESLVPRSPGGIFAKDPNGTPGRGEPLLLYGPAFWNLPHPTHRPESWPRAIVAALVGLLAVAVWCAAIYLVAG